MVLQISRSTDYYKEKEKLQELIYCIKEIFCLNSNNYGTRKIKIELEKEGKIVTLHRIGRIMK